MIKNLRALREEKPAKSAQFNDNSYTFVENITAMTTILIKPKTEAEKNLLTLLLKKMNIEIQIVEEPMPNYETRKAMDDVDNKKGVRVKDSHELFNTLGI